MVKLEGAVGYLVVANQTLGGTGLIGSVQERAKEGFPIHVVVPATDPADEHVSTEGTGPDNAQRRLRAGTGAVQSGRGRGRRLGWRRRPHGSDPRRLGCELLRRDHHLHPSRRRLPSGCTWTCRTGSNASSTCRSNGSKPAATTRAKRQPCTSTCRPPTSRPLNQVRRLPTRPERRGCDRTRPTDAPRSRRPACSNPTRSTTAPPVASTSARSSRRRSATTCGWSILTDGFSSSARRDDQGCGLRAEGGSRGVPVLARSPAADRPGPSDVSQGA